MIDGTEAGQVNHPLIVIATLAIVHVRVGVAQPARPPAWFLLLYVSVGLLLLLVTWYVGIALHELGHLAAALAFRIPVVGLVLFVRPGSRVGSRPRWIGRVRGVELSIGWWPLNGAIRTLVAVRRARPRWQQILYLAAGATVNAVTVLAFVPLTRTDSLIAEVSRFVVLGTVVLLLGSVIGRNSDGRKIWRLLTHSAPA